MTETDFIDQLDCNFPFENLDNASQWLSQAGEISQNATYFVLHEILRAPSSVSTEIKDLLVQMWCSEYDDDPLFRLIERTLPAYRQGQLLSEEQLLPRIEQLSRHHGQFYALTLLVFACATPSSTLQAAYEAVLEDWQSS